MKKTIKTLAVIGLIVSLAAGLTSCQKKESGVKKIQVAHTNYYKPYDFVNENNESDGFEVAVLKEVDKLLPQYEFVYNPTSDDDLLIGVLQGKYDVGTKGVWRTAEREKKYVFPKNPIGASVIGIVVRTETTGQIHDLPSFAKYSGKLVPIGAANAMYSVIDEYNKSAKDDEKIDLIAGDNFLASDAYVWVNEKRYDGYVDIKLSFQNNILEEGAPYADFKDKLSYIPYKGIPTWPLFNVKNQELADAYDEAIQKLIADGTVSKLAIQYFGEDVSALLK
ncbi:MAG: transporter substrate-binding domain-containing protein [Treponemataceae bacterium]|nr:transporter substrate-binding domain-containing protein [Treponemataceae bacterium]